MKYEVIDEGKTLLINDKSYKAISDYGTEFTLLDNKILYKEVLTKDFLNLIAKLSNTTDEAEKMQLNASLMLDHIDNLCGLLALIYRLDNEDIDEAKFQEKRKLFMKLPTNVLTTAGSQIANFFTSMKS